MKRRTTVNVEPLETRSLLSGLTYSLTTNQAVYQVGQPVQMTLTVTNTSSSPIGSSWGGVGSVAFLVRQDGNVVASFLTVPVIVAWTLQPGQSQTLKSTWNEESGGAQATGEFTLTSGFAPTSVSATFEIEPAATPSSPISVTVKTGRPSYQAGHSVRFIATLTNVSKSTVTLTPEGETDGITILEGSTVVWRRAVTNGSDKTRTLAAGQTAHLSFAWDGRPNQPGIKMAVPGLYKIEIVIGGYAGTGTFRIA